MSENCYFELNSKVTSKDLEDSLRSLGFPTARIVVLTEEWYRAAEEDYQASLEQSEEEYKEALKNLDLGPIKALFRMAPKGSDSMKAIDPDSLDPAQWYDPPRKPARKKYLVDLEYWMHDNPETSLADLRKVASKLLEASEDREVFYFSCIDEIDKVRMRAITLDEIALHPPSMSCFGPSSFVIQQGL